MSWPSDGLLQDAGVALHTFDGWEVNGTVIEAANLRPTLNDLATAPASEPETRFRGIVWVDLPDDTPFPRWKSLVSALADSRAIDLVVSEGPRAVPVRGMTYVSQPALMMMAERDVAYVMVAPDGTPPANAPITTRRATPDDIATVASELCKGPTPCWTVIALEPDGMSFGELTTWLTALQPLLYKGRAARIMFDAEWAERLKRD